MFNKTRCALVFATVLAAGCGGSGGPSPSPAGTGPTPQSSPTVVGPLDTVQAAVTTSVISPLVTATANTPLQGVLLCGNSVVTQNVLDIADAFANGLASPTQLIVTTPAQAQAALAALLSNLSGLLTTLNNGALACLGTSGGVATVPTSNPLAGTPLAPIGAALLPPLTSAAQQLTASLNGSAPPITAVQLATILSTLSTAFNQALAQLPSNVTGAPVVGGTLVTVGNALTNLSALANAAVAGASPTTLAAGFQALAQSVLTDVLTRVLPVGVLQNSAGGTAIANLVQTIQSAVATLTASLGTSPTVPLPANPLGGTGFSAISGLVTQLVAALPTGLAGTAGQSPLTAAIGALQSLLNALLAPLTGGNGCILRFLGLC